MRFAGAGAGCGSRVRVRVRFTCGQNFTRTPGSAFFKDVLLRIKYLIMIGDSAQIETQNVVNQQFLIIISDFLKQCFEPYVLIIGLWYFQIDKFFEHIG